MSGRNSISRPNSSYLIGSWLRTSASPTRKNRIPKNSEPTKATIWFSVSEEMKQARER